MQNKRLGKSDLFLSPLGIGAWAIGGAGWAFSWSSQDDRVSVSAIHAALDAGMNWIDTAAVYGLGHSEVVVAKALKSYSGKRPYVFTKCGRNWNQEREIQKDLRASSVRQECEDSLRRLQVDTIDLYQIHWPEPDDSIEEGWETLASLQNEGKVRWIGVSNFNVDQLKRVQKIATVTSLQPPYSLVRPEVASVTLPYAAQQQIGVLAYSPMGSGLLTGAMNKERVASLPADDWRIRNATFQEPLLTRNLKIAEKLGEVGGRHGRSTGEAALAWVLHHPAITAAIVGIRTPEQVDGIRGALEFRLTESEIDELDRFCQTLVA